jgi:hypothetical protein
MGAEVGKRRENSQRRDWSFKPIQFSGRWVGFGEIARQEPDARAGDRQCATDVDAPETSLTGLLA